MSKTRDEIFLDMPPCPFRRVNYGAVHCTISTDDYVSEVDPLTCRNCSVPEIISVPRCRFLSLGTELKPYRGEGKVVTAMACRELGIKLYDFKTCEVCPLYSEVDSVVDTIREQKESAEVQVHVSESVVEEVARDIKLEYGAQDEEAPPLMPIRCWRFPEGRCRKLPIYTRGKVTVILKLNNRNDEIYKQAILPAIRSMKLQSYRIDELLEGDEQLCRCCENTQESDFVILSLDDWDSNTIFLAGIAYGIGRRLAMIKSASLQAVPLVESMMHDVVRYESLAGLKHVLMEHLAPYVKPLKVES
ncbi:hypothetical protein IIA79_08090 [bacterium]|nr:hypothetical protein [bacterium]